MSRQSDQKELAAQYLLGTLSEEETAQMEERYFSDNAEFEEVEIAEEELIDRYVRGELSDADNARFESTLALSPRLTERVRFARVWKDRLTASPSPPVNDSVIQPRELEKIRISWWSKLFGISGEQRSPRLAFALSLLLLLLGGVALLTGWLRLREESRRLTSQQAALEQRQRELDKQAADLRAQSEEIANKVPPQPSPIETPSVAKPDEEPKSGTSILALSLSPGGTRSLGGGSTIRMQPATTDVVFTLEVQDPDYSTYRAIILTPNNTSVFASTQLRLKRSPSGPTVTLRVPAKNLQAGDYSIRLDGRTASGTTETVGDYQFRVLR
ncbi:MAG TPA: hypothetical protein VLA93_05930 [Pyrinomonadaceae bacterium]|nr:hypothetical protein [Pyrinomonadaceae bacterium]